MLQDSETETSPCYAALSYAVFPSFILLGNMFLPIWTCAIGSPERDLIILQSALKAKPLVQHKQNVDYNKQNAN